MSTKSGNPLTRAASQTIKTAANALWGDATEANRAETLQVWTRLRDQADKGTLNDYLKRVVYSYHAQQMSHHSASSPSEWQQRFQPLGPSDLTYNKIRNATISTNQFVGPEVTHSEAYVDANASLTEFESNWQSYRDARASFVWPGPVKEGRKSIDDGAVAQMDNTEYVDATVKDLETVVQAVLKAGG